MLIKHKSKGSTATKSLVAVVSVMTVLSHTVSADTVYRCGEAYSTSSHCANGVAAEVKPSSVLQTAEPDKGKAATRDLRDAPRVKREGKQETDQPALVARERIAYISAACRQPL